MHILLASLCPYCEQRERNSDDHIFPEFLGGSATIRACGVCNNTFGHSSEGPLSKDLAPLVVTLRKSGIKAPRYAVWRKAVVYDEKEWSLDTDLVMRPSRPTIERDGGKIISAHYATEEDAKKLAKHWEKQGKKYRITHRVLPKIELNKSNFNVTIGVQLRRVAMKMCIAVADYLTVKEELVDSSARDFLLGKLEKSDRTRIDWTIHPALEGLRTPLAHLVFVKGNSNTHRCYGVVQLYGCFQLQLILNEQSYHGPDFACVGKLDPVAGYQEYFGMTDLFGIPEAPVHVPQHTFLAAMRQWQEKFTSECKTAFGEQDCQVTLEQG